MNQKGVLLVNLGSPDSPSTPDVRRYLREFLMDGRVLDAPYLIRFGVVHGRILPFRPKESAEAYHKVWLPEGSPLVVISRRVQELLQKLVAVPVELAMRYQNPSIEGALERLIAAGVNDLLLIPMFPHYAMSSYETAVVRVRELARRLAPQLTIKVVPPYYNDPDYVNALVARAQPFLNTDFDQLLFSFHGLPERHLRKADPTGCHCLQASNCCEKPSPAHATCYRAQCFQTARSFMSAAGLPITRSTVSFQSRLGKDPWLQPYTDKLLVSMPARGIRKLLVICPAFVTDCLETIEEIGMRGRETFLAAGGTDFQLIPCLNDHAQWIAFLERLVREFTAESTETVFAEREAQHSH
jgi:ferrochelatase